MPSAKPKQFSRHPPKKKPAKAAAWETADDFQEAADFEENAGGKHRAGDPVKSFRAFVRALEIYDRGLEKHPNSFDLAYNKSRLQLEISQQPALIEHFAVPLTEWLQLTLQSHRLALRLGEDNPDVLFNTAQVMTALAEQLIEDDSETDAVPLLQEALELLSSCLSRQEMMYEQHNLDFPDTDDGGVMLDSQAVPPAPTPDVEMSEEQSAIIETPVSPNDLLDTVTTSLSTLTSLVPLTDPPGLQNLGDLARQLSESKASGYIRLLPVEEQEKARLSVAIPRAVFIAAYASAQFEHQMVDLQTYVERLDAFDIPGKEGESEALVAEAEARTELVLSVIDRFGESAELPATLCWKQLSTSQDVYSAATKLNSGDAKEARAEVYKSKGDLELLRFRLIHIPKTDLAESITKSAQTLIQNAQTYYKGAVSHANASSEDDMDSEARARWNVAKAIAELMYGSGAQGGTAVNEDLVKTLHECVDEGLVSQQLAQALIEGQMGSRS